MDNRKMFAGLAIMAILALFTTVVYAQNTPLGAENVTVLQTEQANLSLYAPDSVFAEAGNVTELFISGVSATHSWQGYYGNVTGTVILEDSQGNRFYDWGSAEPQGEIFASVNQSISWLTVECAPLDDATYLAEWEGNYGMNNNDADSLNRTYNRTDHPTFYVSYRTFTTGDCRSTYTFVSDAAQNSEFSSAVLSSDDNETLIFTALLEDRATRAGEIGFDGADHDFQVLVAEDGSLGNSAITEYYFWVELE